MESTDCCPNFQTPRKVFDMNPAICRVMKSGTADTNLYTAIHAVFDTALPDFVKMEERA